jgi:hypothetical protein
VNKLIVQTVEEEPMPAPAATPAIKPVV